MALDVFFNIFGTLAIVVASFLQIVSFATPYYIERDNTDTNTQESFVTSFGLWELCYQDPKEGTEPTCKSVFDPTGKYVVNPVGSIHIARLFIEWGLLIVIKSAIGTVLTRIAEWRGDSRWELPYIIAVFSLCGAMITITGDALIAQNYRTFVGTVTPGDYSLGIRRFQAMELEEFSLSWGFSLDMAAITLSLVCSVCHLCGRGYSRHMKAKSGSGIVPFVKLSQLEEGTFVSHRCKEDLDPLLDAGDEKLMAA